MPRPTARGPVQTLRSVCDRLGVRDGRALVAVSGGPDSVALLHLLFEARDELALELHVAHLDHALRGDESAADARFVAERATQLGLASTVERIDVAARHRASPHSSLEHVARETRYRFLNAAAERAGARWILLGHTADDQAETVLLNLFRGAGLSGLRGMKPRRGSLVRPLLECRKTALAGWLDERAIAYREDASNDDLEPRRNRLRHELLPRVERHFNERAIDNIGRTTRVLSGLEEWAEEAARAALEEALIERSEEAVALSRKVLAGVHPALTPLAIRLAIGSLPGTAAEIGFDHLERVADLAAAAGGRHQLPGGLVARADAERLEIRRVASAEAAPEWERPVALPGVTRIPEAALDLECEVLEIAGSTADSTAAGPRTSPTEAYMDRDRIRGPLRVRGRRPGDRFHPLGAPGGRKLKEFLIDLKVPGEVRDRLPLLVDDVGIVCVVGHRISERVRVTPATRQVLHARMQA